MKFRLTILLISMLMLGAIYSCPAKVQADSYGVSIDTSVVHHSVAQRLDSLMSPQWDAGATRMVNFLSKPHYTDDNTLDFYLLLCLAAILGGVKTIYPKYFNDLWRAFLNPTLGNRQLKDIIQAASYPNLLMNIFASVVLGAYLYYFISIFVDWRFSGLTNGTIVLLLISGALITYLGKYLFVEFVGWVFHMKNTTDLYNFNIFLVNKILGIFLLPFVVCFAFMDARWDNPICIVSVILAAAFLANRYLRSWNIFAQFFMNSRFHFFMYLCAFEILPMAVLLKLVTRIV
ncbi:DUF4271 domain-containing protein [Rurimicrobium arvi]|uniref:DUF4271 domain-containing protein n=1 Tax=Rurimicrobium arvi TaxID=2049916 RepID=A0ABP8MLS7_9BACT